MKIHFYAPLLGCLVLLFSGFLPGWAANPRGSPSAPGACDSPYPDAQGNVSFTCRGLTDEQIRLIPSISVFVDKLLQSGVEGIRLQSQTDDILRRLRENPEARSTVAPAVKPAEIAPLVPPPDKSSKKGKDKQEVITYDYRGFKTSSLIGPMLIVGDEGESKQYQKLLTVQKAGEWKTLLKDATRETKKVPDWLTPYAFKAVALQHLGKPSDAIAALEYVDQHSVGNSDYDQARLLLKKLRPTP